MKNQLSEADTRSLKKRSLLGQIIGTIAPFPLGMGLYGYEVAPGHVAFTDLQSMPIVWLMLTLGVLLFILGGYLYISSDLKLRGFNTKK